MLFSYLKLKFLENPSEGNVTYFIKCLESEINTYEANRVRMLSTCFDDVLFSDEYDSVDDRLEDLESLAKDVATIVSTKNVYGRDVKDLVSLLRKDEFDFDDEGYISATEGYDPYEE